MSIKIDIPKSEKARADGNASFKKGKWVEAIGHYTTAVVYNPDDPIAYSNRAQAYLKLDKFHDAERDCSTALSLPSGKGSIKALYRRGLARKGLEKLDEAIQDLEEVLKVEKNNDSVKAELDELIEMKMMKMKKEAKMPKRPITPPSSTSSQPSSSSTSRPINQSLPETKQPNGGTTRLDQMTAKTESLDIAPEASTLEVTTAKKDSSSFASLRKSRDVKKKAFVGGSSTNGDGETSNPSALRTSISPPQAGTSASTATSTFAHPTLPTTLDTSSTSPGSGLLLLRHLDSSSPSHNFSLLSLYPPSNVSKILDNLLEPDTLGLILVALEYGVSDSTLEEERKSRVRGILSGLKRTKRWSMNVAMLSKGEKQAGERAWRESDGQGSWS
ncbi:hypothetical protein IAR55_006476 [Kwoniella newhampshirensis]|uniref:RNA polymerase II-associated protein 3 n=1 Tax=Kwoniella newhampshirensis TaxID=1651941 RepID=A0AAW0YU95_9TREE